MRLIFNCLIHFLITLNFLTYPLIKAQKRVECDRRSYKRADDLTAKLLTFGNSGREFPLTQEGVPKYCK